MDDAHVEDGERHNKHGEAAPSLISLHPNQNSVAVAVGPDLRVFDLIGDCGVALVDESCEPFHKDSIRAIRFGAKGKLFLSAGDDKLVKIWSAESWHCIATVVWVVDLPGLEHNEAPVNKKAAAMLSHYCSIITSLEFSPNGQFIIIADCDFKIRVTIFLNKPLDGAHEIQSFCLGHTDFQGIMLLSCDLSSQTLSIVKVVSITGETFIPTNLGSSITGRLLWMVTGASNLPGSAHPPFSRIKVISNFKQCSPASAEHEPLVLEDSEIPGAMKLLEKLQCGFSVDDKVFIAAAEAVKRSMCNLLIKKQYPEENREFRKRTRNDRKINI